jgi:phosphatidylglycerol lysyltransferase
MIREGVSIESPTARPWPGVLLLALRAALLVLATWALRRELSDLDPSDLVRHLRAEGAGRLVAALACTVASFVSLGFIELLALTYVRRDTVVPRRAAMATAFVANAFGQAIGLSLLTGAAVRLRAYSGYRLAAAEVAQVSTFVTFSATLGLLATGAGAFLARGAPLMVGRASLPMQLIGALLAFVVLMYIGWSCFGSWETIGRGAWRIRRPAPSVALRQIAIASLDWLITGTILFLVLPLDGIGYGTVLRVYLLSQAMGTISHVPGGMGVFELFVLALLAPIIAPDQRSTVVASLVVLRLVYYLLPLAIALLVATFAESLRIWRRGALEVHGY